PEELGQIITSRLKIPTIGIGSGRFTDGQVLIVNDILGITPRKLKLATKYQDYQTLTFQAIEQYKEEVEQNVFPSEENVKHMAQEELQNLIEWGKQSL
ncbi:MAG: 3-methyl-2-oxobutanoate hydroxymethyltransferase, partial [Brasilonema sp.]